MTVVFHPREQLAGEVDSEELECSQFVATEGECNRLACRVPPQARLY